MSKQERTIRIEKKIVCGEKTCAYAPNKFCRYFYLGFNYAVCNLFSNKELESKDGWIQRCEECLEHEVKENKG